VEGLSKAEERALVATQFSPFSLQLHEVRRSVKQILDLFGRNNFFAEYTVHDFSHVVAMLEDLEWISRFGIGVLLWSLTAFRSSLSIEMSRRDAEYLSDPCTENI
jgi:hypothetical protein